MSDWLTHPENWAFVLISAPLLFAAFRAVTSRNVVHAVLYLVVILGASAALFLLLGAEFVAWTVVLVYIGAVIVLFLFGIMITRAPLGMETRLSHSNQTKVGAALVAGALFVLLAATTVQAFGDLELEAEPTRTADIGLSIFERFVIPFEVVSVVLLAALIGGIVLARRDPVDDETSLALSAAPTADVTAEGGDA